MSGTGNASSTGIFYIASSHEFLKEAEISARSVKAVMEDASIAVGTTPELKNEVPDVFDETVQLKYSTGDFGEKVYNISTSPFKKTVYLDTDIHIEYKISDIFDTLNKFDLAVAHNYTDYGFGPEKTPDNHPNTEIPESIREFNTGVIGWESNIRTQQFFDQWEKYYNQDKQDVMDSPPDQPSFKRAIYESNVRYLTLPREYNCIFRNAGYVCDRVKVFHGRLRDVSGHGAERTMDVHRAVENLNGTSGIRVYFTSPKTIVYSGKNRYLNIFYHIYRWMVSIIK